jgi:3-hydroxybutyryl-CoA dehydrogenase
MLSVAITSIAVIGAGLMGHGMAQLFAQAGMPVHLHDSNAATLAAALPRIHANLQTCVKYGFLDEALATRIPERIQFTSSLEEAVASADFIFEAVFEEMAVKHRVLSAIEAVCSQHAVIASNSSSFRVEEMAQPLARPARFLATHFWNPPHLIPIVEVTASAQTAPEVVEATCALLRKVGKRPVRVRKDVAGYIGNRLQHALRREAIALVEAGVALPEDVDLVARYGFGLRMPFIGPLETADLGGLDLTLAIQSYLLPDLNRGMEPSKLVRERVANGEVGAKSGKGFFAWTPERHRRVIQQRDAMLLELLQWIQQREEDERSIGFGQDSDAAPGNNERGSAPCS